MNIEDTSSGIPKSEQERIFERFSRIKNARYLYKERSGLGLSIVKHAVELLSGKLGLKSQTDKGSIFWIEIPVA